MKVLLDACVPRPLRKFLPDHTVQTAQEMGWGQLKNGALLQAVEPQFDAFLTSDQNLKYQQNIAGRKLAILVLPTNDWPTLRRMTNKIAAKVATLKPGVFYLQEQAVPKNGRGLLTDKGMVSWPGEPLELGQRLHQAACEHGLGRAQAKMVVSEGVPWIWKVAQDGWPGAVAVLDCYHASQHVWELGEAVMGERQAVRPWVEKQLHQLRHGRHATALKTIARLKAGSGAAGEIIRREQNYFAGHAARRNYRAVADRGWAIGSGPVESACLQRHGRFKSSGQSWMPRGLRHLCALIEARQNGHWDHLWNQ